MSESRMLKLDDLQSAFLVLTIGYGLAISAFLLELVYHKAVAASASRIRPAGKLYGRSKKPRWASLLAATGPPVRRAGRSVGHRFIGPGRLSLRPSPSFF